MKKIKPIEIGNENQTYWEMLEVLRKKINEIVETLNAGKQLTEELG